MSNDLISLDVWSQESDRFENATKYLQYKYFGAATIGKNVYQFAKVKKDNVINLLKSKKIMSLSGSQASSRTFVGAPLPASMVLSFSGFYACSPPSFMKSY
ncbi:hypothetical protein NPIL_513381 [Nephila pilipes]|uniref:Uncharacterized protein n=1 Tax=Nephila pilipes TaxID=299642 RepID=A0A8X6UPC7_NEPPI|nr:hypothetical protein NPIL_513381 [Nephila pilipes]